MDYSIDKSDYLLEYLVEGCGNDELELYKSLDASNEKYGKKFERIRKRILSGKRVKTKREITISTLKRVSMVFLLCFSMAFVTLMSVSATRNAIWGVVFEWCETHFSVKFEPNDNAPTEDEIVTEIKEINKPTDLPEGVEEETLISISTRFICEYYKGDEFIACFQQQLISESNALFLDAENVSVYSKNIGVHYVTITETESEINIFWMDKHYYYLVSGTDLSILEELVKKVK